jgi:glutaredoxin-related protein
MTQEKQQRIVLFSTSTPTTLRCKTSIRRFNQLLNALGVSYEVCDLACEPERRLEMLAASGVSTLPQLHVNGAWVGDMTKVEELNDFGELLPILHGQCSAALNA